MLVQLHIYLRSIIPSNERSTARKQVESCGSDENGRREKNEAALQPSSSRYLRNHHLFFCDRE